MRTCYVCFSNVLALFFFPVFSLGVTFSSKKFSSNSAKRKVLPLFIERKEATFKLFSLCQGHSVAPSTLTNSVRKTLLAPITDEDICPDPQN